MFALFNDDLKPLERESFAFLLFEFFDCFRDKLTGLMMLGVTMPVEGLLDSLS